MFLALDLGTTTLAGRLLDADGRCLAEGQVPNSQSAFGADVLRRLEAARQGRGRDLQAALVAGINDLIDGLTRQAATVPDRISRAAAAANPAVSTLLRNLPTDPLLAPPYRPHNSGLASLPPGETGIDCPAPLDLFPLVSGFVGGDLVAFLYGQGAPAETALFIDVGTNGEIALYADGCWRVTSVAAGPAFEGGGISSGVPFSPGAICGCRIRDGRLVFDVVDGGPPKGLCGSGLADVIAAALEGGLIDRHGTIRAADAVETNLARYIDQSDARRQLCIYRDAKASLFLSQQDIRNLQLAKAAVRAGIDCLLARAGIEADSLKAVVMTGAFGFSLSHNALKRVAILPGNVVDKVRFEADGVLKGVGRMLMTPDGPGQVERFAAGLKPYPLSGTPAFETAFLSAIDF